jgi:post-segregation antitoxin (ccd killing protein)
MRMNSVGVAHMAKRSANLTVDSALLDQAKELGINLSATLERIKAGRSGRTA